VVVTLPKCIASQEIVFDAASIVRGGKIDRSVIKTRKDEDEDCVDFLSGHSIHNSDPTAIKIQTENCFEVAEMVKCGFDGPNACGRCEVCDCNVDWKTSPKVMHKCTLALERAVVNASALFDSPIEVSCNLSKVLRCDKNNVATDAHVACELEARVVPDSDCLAKYILLLNLRDARKTREDCARMICLLQEKFRAEHSELLAVRKRLKIEKFAVRSQRQEVQEESIYLESQVVSTGKLLASTCNRIYEEAQKEIKFFCSLFHGGFVLNQRSGEEDAEPMIPSPLSMKLSECDETLIREIKQEKSDYYENGACEYIDKPSLLQASIDCLPAWPRHYLDALVADQRLVIPKKEEVKVEVSHYKSHKEYHNFKHKKPTTPQSKLSGKAQKKAEKEQAPVPTIVASLPVKDKSKPSRNIPGLTEFALDNIKESAVYVEAEVTKKWSASLARWFSNVEQEWKDDKRTLILSFLQRVRHIMFGGSRYSTLKHNDTRLAQTVDNESAFVLMEFLLCRGGLALKVRINDSKQIYSVLTCCV
jgi:hypothetical protein